MKYINVLIYTYKSLKSILPLLNKSSSLLIYCRFCSLKNNIAINLTPVKECMMYGGLTIFRSLGLLAEYLLICLVQLVLIVS